MEQDFKLPEYLSLQGNPSENWRTWIQRFELYLVAKEKTKKPDPTKIAMLLSAVGPEALERYNHFEWREGEDKNKFDHVKAKFKKDVCWTKANRILQVPVLGFLEDRRANLRRVLNTPANASFIVRVC